MPSALHDLVTYSGRGSKVIHSHHGPPQGMIQQQQKGRLQHQVERGQPVQKQTTYDPDMQQQVVSHDLQTHSRDEHTPMDTDSVNAKDSGTPQLIQPTSI